MSQPIFLQNIFLLITLSIYDSLCVLYIHILGEVLHKIKFGEEYYIDHQVQEDFKIPRISSMDEFLNALCPKEPLNFDGQDMEITNHELGLLQIPRVSSMDEFLNPLCPKEPLNFDGQDMEITNNELGLLQRSGINNREQFIVDARSKASNTSNNGYRGYNNGEDLVLSDTRSQMELNKGTFYNQNFEVLDKDFDIMYAPIDMTQAPLLSQDFVENYEELAFDASMLDVGFEGCTLEDCPQLSTYAYSNMENDKREKTSTSPKQNLVADSPLTDESHGVLSNKKRRRLYNRNSARRYREKRGRHVNDLEALAMKFQKQLIFKNQSAAIALGVSTSTGFNHTGQVGGAKMRRGPSMVRVADRKRLHKRQSGMRTLQN